MGCQQLEQASGQNQKTTGGKQQVLGNKNKFSYKIKKRRVLSGQKKIRCPAQNKMKKNRCLFCILTFPSAVRIVGREGTGMWNRGMGNLAVSEPL